MSDAVCEDILTAGQVAKAIGVSPHTARELMDQGAIPSWHVPNSKHRRCWRIDVARYAAANGIPAGLMGDGHKSVWLIKGAAQLWCAGLAAIVRAMAVAGEVRQMSLPDAIALAPSKKPGIVVVMYDDYVIELIDELIEATASQATQIIVAGDVPKIDRERLEVDAVDVVSFSEL